MDRLLYGAAYYPEYEPCERMEEDMELMEKAGFNLIRVAESAWSTWEPRDGEFDFSILRRTLEAAGRHGLSVIVGTPTYAIPPWLYKKYPDIMAETHRGRALYGPRQSFDLTHPGYRYHCERIIRKLLEVTREYDCVIGYQLDNETKPYDTCSERAQGMFRRYLRNKFGTVEALNRAFGFAYWSNSVSSFDELPDARGTVNASYGAEYSAFQRRLVSDYLFWQRTIVEEYLRPGQLVTHNFDFEWRGYCAGLQPDVDQKDAARVLTVAGCDIYHKAAGDLTGEEITFGGAVARGLLEDNYLVLETQAQGNFSYLPYPGQLRLQAYSHIANGAACVEYWHWHSIHNACESYWKGVLSHDMTPGETYRECAEIGRELAGLSHKLTGLKKENRVAVMVSNRSQTGFNWFPTCEPGKTPDKNYSDYLMWLCGSLHRLNVEYDIVWDSERDFGKYDLLVLPCLYSAPQELLEAIREYVRAGGHVLGTFRTGFSDEYLKIYHDAQPHALTEVFGLTYDRFTAPVGVEMRSEEIALPAGTLATDWMELLEVRGAKTLATLEHPQWGTHPAVTVNAYGEGGAAYLACCFSPEALDRVLEAILPRLGVPVPKERYPLLVRRGVARDGAKITFYLNYSGNTLPLAVPPDAAPLLSPFPVELPPWGVVITEA